MKRDGKNTVQRTRGIGPKCLRGINGVHLQCPHGNTARLHTLYQMLACAQLCLVTYTRTLSTTCLRSGLLVSLSLLKWFHYISVLVSLIVSKWK